MNGSTFQGHAVKIDSIKQAAAARDSLFQLSSVAYSDHVIYAYSVTDPSGMKIVGNSDGGEWAASRLITALIEEKDKTNVFVAVTGKHAGPNLGPKRFRIISEIGSEAIDKVK